MTFSFHDPIVLIGAKGMLGQAVQRVFFRLAPSIPFYSFDHTSLDITSKEAIESCSLLRKAKIILNCAGYTNVEKAEEEEALAMRVNANGVQYLAQLTSKTDALLIHISTDYVFSGESQTPYTPESPPSPLSAYGKSKRRGEEALVKYGKATCLVRTAWLFGWGGKNFVDTILDRGRRGEKLAVVQDQWGSPTFAEDLAQALYHFAIRRVTGIYHCTNQGITTWYDFAVEILRQSGIPSSIEPISTAEAMRRFHLRARRPRYSALDCSSTEKAIGYSMRPWQEALAEYLQGTPHAMKGEKES